MTLTVECLADSPAEWDTFVRFAEGGTHCHVWGWKSVIERVLGHECLYLAARAPDGRVAGVLPLVRVSSRLFGSYLVSMPFLNYGGALGSDQAVQALVARAVEIARTGGVELLEMRSRTAMPVELPVSHRKITVVRELTPGDASQVWDRFPAKVRSQVRRPQKEGMVVRFGPDQVGPFFLVFSRRMRDLGTPTQSRRFFEALVEIFPANVWFGCVYDGAYPVAAGCGFRWNGEFEMTWAASLTQYNAFAPNMLLYWSFIERAAEQGLAAFNFGRCTPGSGTHRFKQQWGGRDVPLWWYQHAAGPRAATPSPDDRAFSWGPPVWRRLPLSIANMLGPRVVRLIP